MPLQKLRGVAIFVSFIGMWIFQPITLHRATNSLQSRNKIRLAFHFVERKKVFVLGQLLHAAIVVVVVDVVVKTLYGCNALQCQCTVN